ncbi:hypothetical protein PENSPDRAFT_689957 [Peniophora sp. CONT]|nr:hypothetical protein PENSPDRAFT_689957 [Peniophora sp. CONT]
MASTSSDWRTSADPVELAYMDCLADITPIDIMTIDLSDRRAHVTQKNYEAAQARIQAHSLNEIKQRASTGDREMKFELALRIASGFTCPGRQVSKAETDDAQLKIIALAQELEDALQAAERSGRGASRKRMPEVYDLMPRVHRLAALTLLESARTDAALLCSAGQGCETALALGAIHTSNPAPIDLRVAEMLEPYMLSGFRDAPGLGTALPNVRNLVGTREFCAMQSRRYNDLWVAWGRYKSLGVGSARSTASAVGRRAVVGSSTRGRSGCALCGTAENALKACGGSCVPERKPFYCSAACQKKDWKRHKPECKA